MIKLIVLVGFCIFNVIQISFSSVVSTGNFNQDFFVSWSPSHVNTSEDGTSRSLKLDQESGSAFDSNQMFLFGQFDVQIKLVPGNSAGTVVAFYLASNQPNRDEIDFEFLGNVAGKPYILQTNVYADGFDDREERVNLWFDPTIKFHTYSILWNIYQIVFMVDSIPIRVYRNHADKGVAYPRWQPMSIKASIWNGENWATSGGKVKIDWSKSPFIASFSNYTIDGCVWTGNPRFCRADSVTNWWNNKRFNTLTSIQRRWFKWVRLHHMIYDYCLDKERFHDNLPKECFLSKY
ncbi:probable xyloglucan endotransglucosylase/hydrolase protein 10 [Mercurialis annua]|uniref:probable xyloglucan endotransglucosylase/hydrolase protein 10 n=1 Tax=Mercurialis annua TaxID=3986 RepID=UPI00215E5666|nr:probable xyloglucan endotransglucosylase/hydrolase protein 10 [Mercurialis annua]